VLQLSLTKGRKLATSLLIKPHFGASNLPELEYDPTCNLTLTSLFRAAYTPDLDPEQYPAVLQLQSVSNTPIEGLWHWFLKTTGQNVKDLILHLVSRDIPLKRLLQRLEQALPIFHLHQCIHCASKEV
jgi:hypothetical protein